MIGPMSLDYLHFDFSGDDEGQGSFDAMASAAPAQLPALQDELVGVLDWAEREFGPAAPLEEGGEWDYELQGVREESTPLRVQYGGGALQLHSAGPATPRVTLSLTLSGSAHFCARLREAFGID
jgi:hypothetical protein